MKTLFNIIIFTLIIGHICNVDIFSQDVKDVSFELIDEQVFIYYTLVAPANEEYEISAFLKRLNDASFSYIPDNISSGIGDGQYAGVKKIIIWDVTDEEFDMFDGDDFYFEVFAEKVKKTSGGIPWYYYAGTAVVGGAVAAILLGGNGSSDENGSKTSNFPPPPARP